MALIDRLRFTLTGAGPEVEKLSPLDASTKYLRHLVETWAVERADALLLREQQVVLTVPASFDAVARDLTVQAAPRRSWA